MKKLLTLLLTVVLAVGCCFGILSCGKKNAEKPYNGIVKIENLSDIKVGLICLHGESSTYDKNFIDAFNAALTDTGFDMDYYGGRGLAVCPEMGGEDAAIWVRTYHNAEGGRVEITLTDAEGIVVGVGDDNDETIVIEKAHLWHGIEDPYLYTCEAVLYVDGVARDKVSTRFGCRSFRIDSDKGFILNGKPYPLRGVCRHQDWKGIGNAITREHHDTDMALIREVGANTIRLAHYQHDQYFYDLCDEKGLLCWVELPASALVWTNEVYVSRLKETAREMIAQNRNHPSLFVWSLYNELFSVWDGQRPEMEKAPVGGVIRSLQKLFAELDPAHPTTGAWCTYSNGRDLDGIVDVAASNFYPGFKRGDAELMTRRIDGFFEKAGSGRKTLAIGEYGSFASVFRHFDPYADPDAAEKNHAEEWQVAVHHDQYACIKKDPRVWGSYVWMMFDTAADNRNLLYGYASVGHLNSVAVKQTFQKIGKVLHSEFFIKSSYSAKKSLAEGTHALKT